MELFTMYSNLLKFPVGSPAILERHKSTCFNRFNLSIYIRFRSQMQTKQEPVDSLNFF